MPKPPKIKNPEYTRIFLLIVEGNNRQNQILKKMDISEGELKNKLSYLHNYFKFINCNLKRARGVRATYSVNYNGIIQYMLTEIVGVSGINGEMPQIEKSLQNYFEDYINLTKPDGINRGFHVESGTGIPSMFKLLESFILAIAEEFDNKELIFNDAEYKFCVACYDYKIKKEGIYWQLARDSLKQE